MLLNERLVQKGRVIFMAKTVYPVCDSRWKKNNECETEVTTTYGPYETVKEASKKRDALIQIYLADGEDFYTTDKDSDFAPRISSDSDENCKHKIQIIKRTSLKN
jgi:hypothetical protein